MPWIRVAGVAVLAAVVGGAVGCVVEREPAPPRPLLRDTLSVQPPRNVPAAPSASARVDLAPPLPDGFRACERDSDCVAILPNGCCQDGRHIAINKGSVEAYTSSFTCPTPRPICPMHLVLDSREPVCNVTSHLCELSSPQG